MLCTSDPPDRPLNGYWTWTNGFNFRSRVIYTCSESTEFLAPIGAPDILSITATCQWNKTWSRDQVQDCEREFFFAMQQGLEP